MLVKYFYPPSRINYTEILNDTATEDTTCIEHSVLSISKREKGSNGALASLANSNSHSSSGLSKAYAKMSPPGRNKSKRIKANYLKKIKNDRNHSILKVLYGSTQDGNCWNERLGRSFLFFLLILCLINE